MKFEAGEVRKIIFESSLKSSFVIRNSMIAMGNSTSTENCSNGSTCLEIYLCEKIKFVHLDDNKIDFCRLSRICLKAPQLVNENEVLSGKSLFNPISTFLEKCLTYVVKESCLEIAIAIGEWPPKTKEVS
jgi:hypothetical protein